MTRHLERSRLPSRSFYAKAGGIPWNYVRLTFRDSSTPLRFIQNDSDHIDGYEAI